MGVCWEKSGFVERDDNDIRAGGALAYFFLGGTTTPLAVHEDAGESTPHDHPVVADANGRWPAVFIPYTTSYDVQVTTSSGVQLYYHEEIPNPDPVEQAASTPGADELIATGHVHWEPVNTTKAGYARLNGRTIGSATSGGTERANADCEDLFLFLWNNLANGQAAVSAGRGASAAADWAANKTIAVPDLRCSSPMGVADMGSSTATGYASAPFAHGAATTAGSLVGANTHALITAELATHLHVVSITSAGGSAHTHTFSGALSNESTHTHDAGSYSVAGSTNSHSHTMGDSVNVGAGGIPVVSASGNDLSTSSDGAAWSFGSMSGASAAGSAHTHGLGTLANSNESAHTHSVSGNTNNNGSGTAHNNVSFGLLGTWFIKL